MLVLFDIDGTLLHARGAGVRSMEQVGRRLFHPGFSMEGIAFAGRLDPLIWQDAAAANGIGDAEAREAEFRRAYAEAYAAAVADGHATATLLPGVAELLAALAEAEIACGIVTGNYPETGRLKISGAGLEPARFAAAAWGSDGRHRRDLPPVAIERFARTAGRPIDAASVLVIGDTPHDVDCARHAGCRSLAVGTGPSFTRAEIEAAGPDHFVADLGDTDRVLGLITALLGGADR